MVHQLTLKYNLLGSDRPIVFDCLSSSTALPGVDYTITQENCIRIKQNMGSRYRLFRAQLEPSDQNDVLARDVFLKITVYSTDRESLSREADLYEQGVFKGLVPQFYGLFQAKLPWPNGKGHDTVACLVLEYCGEPVPTGTTLKEMGRDVVRDVMKKLFFIHDAGFKHGNFSTDKILITPDSPPRVTIVDLAHVEKHECHRDGTQEGEVAPWLWKDYGCEEIYEFAIEFGYFFDQYVVCMDVEILVQKIKSAEHLVYLICGPPDPLPAMNRRRLAEAHKAIAFLEKEGHPDYCPDPNWRLP